MKVFMIGGTGLLGAAAAEQFIKQGDSVKTLALPPLPEGAPLPKEMEIIFKNVNDCDDAELEDLMKGCDCLVYAAGVDERAEFPAPVYDSYYKFNIAPLKRLMPMAKKLGYKSCVVLNSYFSYLCKMRPDMKMYDRHPYVRSRIDQENYALSLADENFSVGVLELPYIFGTQPGRRPVWTILIEQLKRMDNLPATFYPRGGTAMLTVRQVGEVIVGAAKNTKGGRAWPISCYNLTWDEFLKIVYDARGMGKNRMIVGIPAWMMRLGIVSEIINAKKKGIETGLNYLYLPEIMDLHLYMDPDISFKELGATPDDIRAAIFDSIKVSSEVVDGGVELLGMKGE